MQPQPQPVYVLNAPNPADMIRCKLPSPFDGGYADIIIDPQNFVVLPPVQEKKSFFDKLTEGANKVAHQATSITKNFVDNRKPVICVYCTAYQTIDNNQINYYCCNCKYLNNKAQAPIRKPIFCGNCNTKQEVDLGTTWFTTCSKCARLNIIPLLKPMLQVPPGHPCLNDAQSQQNGQQIQQNYNGQLQQQQAMYNVKQ
ncbi:hypothetical protein ABPG74_014342 [Tetrahymena malaccensis]